MKHIRFILQGIDQIEIFPMIAFFIFFLFFIYVIISTVRTKKEYIDELAALPFEHDEEIIEINKKI